MVPDNAIIRHISGGKSTLGFKSYDQGRTKWQADTLDFVWFDEEPPQGSVLRVAYAHQCDGAAWST